MEKRKSIISIKLSEKEDVSFRKLAKKYYNGNLSELIRNSVDCFNDLVNEGVIDVENQRKGWRKN